MDIYSSHLDRFLFTKVELPLSFLDKIVLQWSHIPEEVFSAEESLSSHLAQSNSFVSQSFCVSLGALGFPVHLFPNLALADNSFS